MASVPSGASSFLSPERYTDNTLARTRFNSKSTHPYWIFCSLSSLVLRRDYLTANFDITVICESLKEEREGQRYQAMVALVRLLPITLLAAPVGCSVFTRQALQTPKEPEQ